MTRHFDRHPVHADTLGAPGYGHRLGDFTAAAFDTTLGGAGCLPLGLARRALLGAA